MKKILFFLFISINLLAQQAVTVPLVINNTGTGYTEVLAGSLGTDINPFSYILDSYTGAAAAYSYRKLRSAYSGNCIRVRRSSDNTEQNIGFSNNVLDELSLTTFCGASDGFIAKWYDQSGNANDLIQSTTTAQPKIVSSGVVLKVNSRPAGLWDGTSDFLDFTSAITSTQPFSAFQVSKRNTAGTIGVMMSNVTSANAPIANMHYSDDRYYVASGATLRYTAASAVVPQMILTSIYNATAGYVWVNGSSQGLTSSAFAVSGNFTKLGARAVVVQYGNGYVQEVIFYASDKTSIVSGVNGNINAFYTIY